MGKKKADAAMQGPHAEGAPPQQAPLAASAANDTVFDELLALVRRDTGMDVTQYREATLRRRVERRRRLLNLPSDDAYLGYLRLHPDEVQALQRSFLISVTSFFRDAPAFAALRTALRRLVDEKPVDQPLRVWVPACATGEEAYSVAIVLLEALAGRTRRPEIKIFATDLDAAAIGVAKQGRYDPSELEGLDPQLQARYFRPGAGHHEVAPEVRDLCLFAQHDVVRDVPFTRLDLVSCRNLLIYFKPALQAEILRRFQYALHAGGLLLLGRAESLAEETAALFEPLEAHQRLFRRKPGPPSLPLRGPVPAIPALPGAGVAASGERAQPQVLQQAMRDALLAWYAPASVLFDATTLAPLHFHGANERYLLFPQGSASFDLPSLLPEPLRGEFHALLALLRERTHDEASSPPVPLQRGGAPAQAVRLRLRRLPTPPAGRDAWLLSFEDLPAPPPADGTAATHELGRLREELDRSREQSRALVQALDSSNRALQASNRELQMSAEELQTSNEELHATNEELSTVNDELQAKSEELARLNETLSNIQDSIRIGLVVVDQRMRVLRYNELAVRVFGLLPGDIGRPLDEVPRLLELPRLEADVAEVVRSGRPMVRRAVRDDFHYLVQIGPYVNRRGERVGAVLSFSDVSELRAAELAQHRVEQRFRLITEALTEVVWMSTPGLRQLLYLSPSFEALWGLSVAQAMADPQCLLTTLSPTDRHNLLERLGSEDGLPWSAEFPLQRADGLQRWVRVQGRGVLDEQGHLLYQVCTATDMTDRVRSEQSVRESERQFRELAHSLPALVFTTDAQGRCDFVNEQWLHYTGCEAAQQLGDGWLQQVHPQDQLRTITAWQEAVAHGQPFEQEFRLRGRDGQYRWFDTHALPQRGPDGQVLRWFGTNTDVDDRKQAEARLQRNVQLIQLVMDSVPALVSYLDEHGVYRWVNRHYSEWFQVDRHAIVGRSFREVVGDVIYQEAGPLLARALQGETVASTRRAKRAHWSEVRWIHITYTPDRAEDGHVRGVVTTVRDITAEREATQALQASEARANRIVETAPQAMLIVDEHGLIERANQRAQWLFGTGAAPLVGLPAERLLPDWPRLQQPDAHEIQLWTGVRADGSRFPAEVGLGPLEASAGRAVIVTVQDISLQVEAQRVLTEHQGELERLVNERTAAAQQAEAQMRLILESTADGLYGVNAQGQITFVNVMASTLLGYAADAMTHRPARELLLPLRPDGTPMAFEDSPLAHTLRTGEPQREEHALFRRRDGSTMPVVYAVRAMWRRGEIVGAVVSFSDISERLAAEAAREAALTEAERLARVRTEFLTNMSHEIRTPLNAVLGLAEVAARGDRDRPPEETFRMILDSGQVLLGVVNDILDFSKIEAGKLRTESQPFELGPVIDRAVSLVAPRIFAKGLRFSIDEAPDLPCRLRGDALRLTQVLGNLLSNAQKFTEHGGVQLRVWCDLHDLWLTVTDSGIGIGPEQMERLFTPFEQADSSTTRRFGGSGLGLVISRYLMDLMGGSIAVRSQPGMGSTFTLRLPMLEPEPVPELQKQGRIVLAELGEIDHVPEALRHRGFEVVSVSTAVALRQHASLVVLDIDALADERQRDAAIAAVQQGRRLALLTHPMAAELPPELRGHVVLLEQPLRARHIAGALSQPERQQTSAESGGRLAGVRVLAAEDNEVNALVLEAIMRIEDAQLTLVDNGERAVEQVREHGPGGFDLVLTDIQMPVMDGYDATREMLALDPTLPVIGLTAHAMPEERDRCLAAGMVDHLPKPIEVEQLVAAVLRHARPNRASGPRVDPKNA